MKRLSFITPLLIVICFTTCVRPDKEIPVPIISINEMVNPSYESVSLTFTVSGNITFDYVNVDYSKDNSLAECQTIRVQKLDETISTAILDLEPNTTYYYRYTFENNISKLVDNQIRQFHTLEYTAPIVKTIGAKDVVGRTATLEGEILYTRGEKIIKKGFYLGRDKDNILPLISQLDGLVLTATDLSFNTTYYYQAFVETEVGIGKGEILMFTTSSGIPEMDIISVANITVASAEITGEITSDGGSAISECGFCYSESELPTINSLHITIDGTPGRKTSIIQGLAPATKYYVRIYAVNEAGTHYGNEVVFTTEAIKVTGVSLDRGELTLTVGDTETLTATVAPANATDPSVIWTSSNPKVASVDDTGIVTAIAAGKCTVQVSSSDGNKQAMCSVTVLNRAESIVVSPSKSSLYIGEKQSFSFTVYPQDAAEVRVSWSVSNPDIAEITQDGYVTAKAKGYTEVIATTDDGRVKGTADLEVLQQVTAIMVDPVTLTDFYVGESRVVKVHVFPSDASNKNYTVTMSPEGVVSTQHDGTDTTIKAMKEGVVEIRFWPIGVLPSDSETIYASCKAEIWSHVASVSLVAYTSVLTIGTEYIAEATVVPATAHDAVLEWSSSNQSVITIESVAGVQNGSKIKLCALKLGESTITAKARDSVNGASASFKVSVLEPDVTEIILDRSTVELLEGDTVDLLATVSPQNAGEKRISWRTSDIAVATVDPYGKVTALSAGPTGTATATITAASVSNPSVEASCAVTVKHKPVKVTGVELNKTNFVIETGKTEQLVATILPANADNTNVTWRSSNTQVATVSQSGLVDAIAPGTAEIIATTEDGGYQASCIVTVESAQVHVTSLILDSSLALGCGETVTLIATVLPSNATNKKVLWTSSHPSIASVSDGGVVKAGDSNGTAIITATSDDNPSVSASCVVSVRNVVHVEGISLNYSSLTINAGETKQLSATVVPLYADNTNVTWGSSNTQVATVSQNGLVEGIAPGTAAIIATTEDGGYQATCAVTVESAQVHVTSISLSSSYLELECGTSITLFATVYPSNAANKKVNWSSSDPSIAQVSEDGVVTAVSFPGTATITATAEENPSKYASCIVKVNPTAVDLGLSVKWATFNVGATKPEEYGDYFAWGETEPKSEYSWSNYKWCNGSETTLTRYCPADKTTFWGGSGSPDGKTEFKDYDYEDDAARANWGGSWRMPTDAEWTELRTNCTWTWTTNYNGTGVTGIIVTSKKSGYTNKSIFLPAAGYRSGSSLREAKSYGDYLSSSLYTVSPGRAYGVNFRSGNVGHGDFARHCGFSVRPVTE